MNTDARRVVVTEGSCGACDTPHIQVDHVNFPEMRITGSSAAEAAERLVDRLKASLDVVTDSAHRDPVRQAIADLRDFLDAEGDPHIARDI